MSPVGIGSLDGLRRRARVLGLVDRVPPVVKGVVKEDFVAVLLAGGTALLHDVPQRRCGLEEPELWLEVLLAVLLGLTRPEGIGPVHEHLGRKGIYAVLPDLELPVGGRPEREVASEIPLRRVLAEDPGRRVQHRHTLVVPGPAHVREVTLKPRSLAHALEISWSAVSALAPVVEDARMKDGVHPELGEGPPQREERGIV